MVYNACFLRHYAQSSQRAHQSFAAMRWEKEYGELYVKTSRTQGQDRLNSAAAPPKEFKENLEEILSSMVFAQIQTCTSFHEMGHACACVRPRVHVSRHRAVSVALLAESYLVFAASECCMCHGEDRRFHALKSPMFSASSSSAPFARKCSRPRSAESFWANDACSARSIELREILRTMASSDTAREAMRGNRNIQRAHQQTERGWTS